MEVAVIGAGLAGLVVADGLRSWAKVTVFEKSRGVGGRMSTRRAEPFSFDHGAQFFRARSAPFKNFLAAMIEQRVVQPWCGRFVEIVNRQVQPCAPEQADITRYVAVPGMSGIAKQLRKQLQDQVQVQVQTRVAAISRQQGRWLLTDDRGVPLGSYDWVVFAVPAEQARELLPTESHCYPKVCSIQMQACFALMLGFEQPLQAEFDGARIQGEDISWVAMNHSKPGRTQPCSLVVHSSNPWADAHIDDDRSEVAHYLGSQLRQVLTIDVSSAAHTALHGWRYANVPKQTGEPCLIDTDMNIGLCGDWLIEGNVEAAFTSARALLDGLIKLPPFQNHRGAYGR